MIFCADPYFKVQRGEHAYGHNGVPTVTTDGLTDIVVPRNSCDTISWWGPAREKRGNTKLLCYQLNFCYKLQE